MGCRFNKIKRIIKYALFAKTQRWVMVPILLLILIAGSGFTGFKVAEPHATRGDLAIAINNILIKTGLAQTLKSRANFVDMSEAELSRIRFTLATRIMSGFPDGTFRPELPLRNLETRNYLRKLALLFSGEAHSELRLQLNRMLAWQDLSTSLLNGFHGNLVPYELVSPHGLTPRSFVDRVPDILGLGSKVRLRGVIVDAVSHLPVDAAHMVVAGSLITTDHQGNFELEIDSAQLEKEELFVAAEGYRPLRLKRDWRINPHVELRLNPVRSDLSVMAISHDSVVEDFEVIINKGKPVRGELGVANIGKLRPGFHRIRVRAAGYEEYEGNLRTQDGKREMIVSLTPVAG